VLHPRVGFGRRRVVYRHYLPELARMPQALRQVAPELLAELAEPWDRLWQLLAATHGQLKAARVLAKLLGVLEEQGEARIPVGLRTSQSFQLISLPRQSCNTSPESRAPRTTAPSRARSRSGNRARSHK